MTLAIAILFAVLGWAAFLAAGFYAFKRQQELYQFKQEQVRVETQLQEAQARLLEQKKTFEESQNT